MNKSMSKNECHKDARSGVFVLLVSKPRTRGQAMELKVGNSNLTKGNTFSHSKTVDLIAIGGC